MGWIPQSTASDPWLDGWDWRQEINITGATGAGTDYQVFVNVTYNAYMQTDFDDICFTDDDAETLLDHYLEYKVDSTFAEFWVEVADSLETDGMIYMYWGNSTVSSSSNGKGTFLLFDDFEDDSINATIWNTNLAPAEAGGELFITNGGGNGEAVYGVDTYLYGRLKSNVWIGDPSSTYGGRFGFVDNLGGANDQDASFWQVNATTTKVFTDNDSGLEQDIIGDFGDAYYDFEITWNSSTVNYYVSDTLEATHTTYVVDEAKPVMFQSYRAGSLTKAKWVFLTKYVGPDPSITFGDIEGPDWNDIASAILNLSVDDPTLEWGYEVFLVLAGLVLLVCSGLYLVIGGRKNFSSDKLLIFLIVFLVGIGLFVGGIMP